MSGAAYAAWVENARLSRMNAEATELLRVVVEGEAAALTG
jgi:hypothetical protein